MIATPAVLRSQERSKPDGPSGMSRTARDARGHHRAVAATSTPTNLQLFPAKISLMILRPAWWVRPKLCVAGLTVCGICPQ
jgi:hypothetical protein